MPSREDAAEAGKIASGVAGVASVRNELRVRRLERWHEETDGRRGKAGSDEYAMLPLVKLARRYRRLIALFAMAALAFAQAAVAMTRARSRCPMRRRCRATRAGGRPDAQCPAHCQAGAQSVDQAKPLAAADVVAPLFTVVKIDLGPAAPDAVRAEPVLAHAASPPLPILYQRFLN